MSLRLPHQGPGVRTPGHSLRAGKAWGGLLAGRVHPGGHSASRRLPEKPRRGVAPALVLSSSRALCCLHCTLRAACRVAELLRH